ncbi:hypothetical protein [Halococcus thailandensis]|uniref:Uncharacterized protein n=1 Tax=Halococcus thailandensis JCM 13552 TaxID=1227457 RepID=M0NAX1_9EURY|nr:hypothetical protein [Halococcus thailandensis]EMA54991.1 hypothetical protein C451_05760 [Halococcus thailandensis JCM 13552]
MDAYLPTTTESTLAITLFLTLLLVFSLPLTFPSTLLFAEVLTCPITDLPTLFDFSIEIFARSGQRDQISCAALLVREASLSLPPCYRGVFLLPNMYQRAMGDDSSDDSGSESSKSSSSKGKRIETEHSAKKRSRTTDIRGNAGTKEIGDDTSQKSGGKDPQGNVSPSAEGESIPNSVDAEASPSDSASSSDSSGSDE